MSAERSLRLTSEDGRRDACPTLPSDGVGAWLRVLEPLLKLPEPERRAIVDELESHLRERVREQLIAGVPENDAVRGAIGELGDAAELARRFRNAGRTPTRRLAMNMAMIGVAGAALVTSIVAVTRVGGDHTPAASVYQPEPAKMKATATNKGKAIGDVKFDNIPLVEALGYLAETEGLTLRARWDRMGEAGIEKGEQVSLAAKDANLEHVFDLLNEGRQPGGALEYRILDKTMEVSTRQDFDRREADLVSFDISAVTAQGVTGQELIQAIYTLVEPEHWADNGGMSGTMAVVGKRLFIKAPARMWKKAAWIIDQVAPDAGAGKTKPAAAGEVPILSEVPILDRFFVARVNEGPVLDRFATPQRAKADLLRAQMDLQALLDKGLSREHVDCRKLIEQIRALQDQVDAGGASAAPAGR